MEKETFDKYLTERYYKQLEYYDTKAGLNQKRYKTFQWTLIILSALTPVLAALDGKGISLQIPVVIASAIVAILTTGLKTFQYQDLWVSYRATQEKLNHEIHYYHFKVGSYSDPGLDNEAFFVTRIEAILDKEHAGWMSSKKMNDEQGKNEKGEKQEEKKD